MLRLVALLGALGLVGSCGARSIGTHDAGDLSSGRAGAPGGDASPGADASAGRDASPGADTAPGDPPPPKPNCEQKAVDLKDVCADPATCAVRRAVDLDCGYNPINRLDLAVAPTGTAFVAFGLDGPNVVALFEIDAPRHLELSRPSYVRPIVRAGGPDGARVFLNGPIGGPGAVARPVDGDWMVEPLKGLGAVFDFVLAADGTVSVLESRVGGVGPLQLVLTDLAASSAPATIIAEGPQFEYAKVARARDGSPVVVFTQPESSRLVVRRWQAGAVADLGTLPREHLGPPYPALRLAVSLAPDDSTVAVVSGEAGLVRLPAVPLLPVGPWPTSGCGGFMIVNSPGLCPVDSRPKHELGEQVVAHALGGTWLAAITGSFQTTCSWGGSCFETKPCECTERETVDVQTSRLLVRSADGSARETSIALSRSGTAATVAAATDAAGLVYVAAHDTPTRVRLFVIDPARL